MTVSSTHAALTPEAARDRRNARRVRRLIRQFQRGQAIARSDIIACCPYRTLFSRPGVDPTDRPITIVTALGHTAEDFSHRMRADIVAAVHRGEPVLLISNSRAVRDHAKSELMLALAPAAGAA